ncbi:MAG: hypothetical protein JWN32_3652, partial [Solirubrobacterales bacterium]|nr:hypothetical protein [Solirubrobacterales bacterium]
TLGDTLTATYSERLDATTFCSTWNNTGTGTQSIAGSGAVTVTIANTGTNDTLTITAVGSSCGGTGNFKFGSVALGGNYVNADTTYSGSGGSKSTLTWDPVAHTLAIMLGTPSAAGNTGIAAGTPTYTPSAALKDLAGNTISASAFTASGTSRF